MGEIWQNLLQDQRKQATNLPLKMIFEYFSSTDQQVPSYPLRILAERSQIEDMKINTIRYLVYLNIEVTLFAAGYLSVDSCFHLCRFSVLLHLFSKKGILIFD